MAVEETIKIKADATDAVKAIKKLEDSMEKLQKAQKEQAEQNLQALKKVEKSNKKTASATSKLAKGFKGVGLAMKAAGFGLIMKLVDKLTEGLMSNQQVADAVNTVFTAIGLVAKQLTDALFSVFQKVSDATGGFDAMQKVVINLLKIAFTPLKLAFLGIKGAIQGAQLMWEQSWFGGGDEARIAELKEGLAETGEQIKQAGKDAVEAGKQVVTNMGEAIGEVSMLVTESIDAVTEVVDNLDAQQIASDAKRLVALKKNYELIALQQQRLVEEYDRAAEELRQIRDDEQLSIKDRMKANEDLGKVLEEQAEAEKATVRARIGAIQEEIRLKGSSQELTNELYQLNTELAAVDAKVAGFKSEQLTNQNALIKEQQELTKATAESESMLDLDRKRFAAEQEKITLDRLEALRVVMEEEKKIELERLQNQIDLFKEGTQARIDAQIAYNERKQELEQELKTNENAINAERSKNQIKWEELTQAEKLDIISTGFKNLSSILGEESAAGKAAAISAATIDTFNSATASYNSLAGIPVIGPALGAAAAGAAIVSGIANVKKIAATKTPGGKSAGATPSISGGGRPGAGGGGQAPAFNMIGSSGTNQLADAISGQQDKPVRAYVTSNEVTTAQGLERSAVQEATL